ncbi:MAG: SUMF1/EgtB/PvdO family nonheme iron enzyme [Chromatiaceae bacterium]|nr:SUMF1/EgtB/PvdO family nonheme iron enzyme [Chromatiaceae bacterium]
MSDRDFPSPEKEAAKLRAELERVQAAARQSLSHLRGELDYLRETQEADRDVDSVTQQVALEQQLDTVRNTLREKERILEDTAAQCRRLEDELEDQHLAYDGLKQELERKTLSLTAAREQVAVISLERHDIQKRYDALLSLTHPGEGNEDTIGKAGLPITGSAVRFMGGVLVGILLSVIAFGLWIWFDPPSMLDGRSLGLKNTLSPAPELRQAAPSEVSPGSDKHPGVATAEEQSGALVLGTVRDRLSDGSGAPVMLVLQGGVFTMGKQVALPEDDDGPAHVVHIGQFLIGATEVTFEEYDRFVRATGRRIPSDFGWGRGDRPVVDVSWGDARAYAEWLTRRTGKGYRLPSEAEWEYAAAAGRRSFFWWGNQAETGRAVCFDCGTMWDNYSSAPVGSLDPNPLGLYDTAGNVMEWVADCYHASYVGAPLNGQPWGGENCRYRVARGGAFNKPARSMRTSARQHFAAETRINALGFRLARDD